MRASCDFDRLLNFEKIKIALFFDKKTKKIKFFIKIGLVFENLVKYDCMEVLNGNQKGKQI